MATNLEKKSFSRSEGSSFGTNSKGVGKKGYNSLSQAAKTALKQVKIGDICNLKITALGPNNIGIDEFSFPFAVFVPNAKYGSKIRAKMVKIVASTFGGFSDGKKHSREEVALNNYKKGKESAGSFATAPSLLPAPFSRREKSEGEKLGVTGTQKALPVKSYAVAQLIEELKQPEAMHVGMVEKSPVKPGDVLTVSIKKMVSVSSLYKNSTNPLLRVSSQKRDAEGIGSAFSKGSVGVVELENNFRLIIPLSVTLLSYENVKVMVTRIKKDYGFAKILLTSLSPFSLDGQREGRQPSFYPQPALAAFSSPRPSGAQLGSLSPVGRSEKRESRAALPKGGEKRSGSALLNTQTSAEKTGVRSIFGSKFTTTLPSNIKVYGKYAVLKVEGKILFVKLEKGVNLGDKVRIKITSASSSFSVGKILQVNPVKNIDKTSLIMSSIREMVNHGMHFGEKAVKCHARMKNYIWFKGSGETRNEASLRERNEKQGPTGKAQQKKALPLIKKGRHIINLLKTRRCLNQALNKLTKYALKGRTFLFIGTKKPASGLVARASFFTKNSFYVNTRWLGGMLTNWKTICKSISKIRPILKEKQKVVRDILERRQTIKSRLIKKALLLKNKSKLILTKGRILLESLKKAGQKRSAEMASHISLVPLPSQTGRVLAGQAPALLLSAALSLPSGEASSPSFLPFAPVGREKRVGQGGSAQKYMSLRNEYITRNMNLLEKRQKFIQKRRELIIQTILLKEKGLQISSKHKAILNQLAIYTKKLRDYKYLLILTSEIQNLKTAGSSSESPAATSRFLASSASQEGLGRGSATLLALSSPPLLGMGGLASPFGSRSEGTTNLVSVSYSKLKEGKKGTASREKRASEGKGVVASLSLLASLPSGEKRVGREKRNEGRSQPWIIPNPPKEILNKIVLTMKNQYENNSLVNMTGKSTTSEKKGREGSPSGNGQGSGVSLDSLLPTGARAPRDAQIIVCSTLLSKFSGFSSYIKSVIKQLVTNIIVLEAQSNTYSMELNKVKNTLKTYSSLKQKYVSELQQLKNKLTNERSVISIVKRQLKALDAQKKLIKFLPRLRYLPTPQTKISEIVQILLSKIVDPKLKFPIENIYDQKLSNSSKKLAAARKKKWQRLEKYFGGIANMTKLTKTQISRNVAIIIGQKEEMNAVYECKKLGIKMFSIVDTNCNPSLSDHIIPANDDSRSSIKYILTKFITRIRLAQKMRSRFPAIFSLKQVKSEQQKLNSFKGKASFLPKEKGK